MTDWYKTLAQLTEEMRPFPYWSSKDHILETSAFCARTIQEWKRAYPTLAREMVAGPNGDFSGWGDVAGPIFRTAFVADDLNPICGCERDSAGCSICVGE